MRAAILRYPQQNNRQLATCRPSGAKIIYIQRAGC